MGDGGRKLIVSQLRVYRHGGEIAAHEAEDCKVSRLEGRYQMKKLAKALESIKFTVMPQQPRGRASIDKNVSGP